MDASNNILRKCRQYSKLTRISIILKPLGEYTPGKINGSLRGSLSTGLPSPLTSSVVFCTPFWLSLPEEEEKFNAATCCL